MAAVNCVHAVSPLDEIECYNYHPIAEEASCIVIVFSVKIVIWAPIRKESPVVFSTDPPVTAFPTHSFDPHI